MSQCFKVCGEAGVAHESSTAHSDTVQVSNQHSKRPSV